MSLLRDIVELPTLLSILIAFGVVVRLRYRGFGTCLVGAAALVLYAAATPVVSDLLLRSLSSAPYAATQSAGIVPPGAIVILAAGGRPVPDGRLEADGLTLERLQFGARLQRATRLPVLVSGGPQRDEPGEPLSAMMRRTLAGDFGVSDAWTERRSRTTAENALYSTEILRAKGIRSVYLVTNAWHMRRAVQAFDAAGMPVVPAPIGHSLLPGRFRLADLRPTARGLLRSQYAFHEWLGSMWYSMTLPLT